MRSITNNENQTLDDPKWIPVDRVAFDRRVKRSDPTAPPTLRVSYFCEDECFSDFLSFERDGKPRRMAERWWDAMGGSYPPPITVDEVCTRAGNEIAAVDAITISADGDFWRVTGRHWHWSNGDQVEVDRCY